ncbi:unnamed protein product [Polarella glacialis]|uniref:Uncharacterized protein n=1 Tax=Polarella glacialis TaxID=89957 RepID=A0A813FG33_POLGL|nr:unnamed protein product [Polarella glacialis]
MRRQRSVDLEAKNGGKPCVAANTTQVVPCNTQPCSGAESCSWTGWTTWNQCSAVCDGGEKKRYRTLAGSDLVSSMPKLTSLEAMGDHPALAEFGVFSSLVLQHRLQLCALAAIGAISLGYFVFLFVGRLHVSQDSQRVRWLSRRVGWGSQADGYVGLGEEDAATIGDEVVVVVVGFVNIFCFFQKNKRN